MSAAKHTSGPWCAMPEEADKPYIRIRGTRLGQRFKIANVLMPVYEGEHEHEAQETRANARLIAAAPDLLAALRNYVDGCSLSIDALAVARAAIAKATGGAL